MAKPLEVHVPFHRSSALERALFGAFGSGKSYAGCDEAIAWMLEQPGIRGLGARKTIPELRDTLEPVFLSRMPPDLLAACKISRTGGHIASIIFPNGSEILFRSLDDWNKHRSLNLGFLMIDEANEIDEETYMGMRSRVRQRDLTEEARARGYTGEITRRGTWVMTNPNGHDWLWQRFIRDGVGEYFKSTSLDNPWLPPDYMETLLGYPEPWVRRYVLCSFEDFAGQIYADWDQDNIIDDYQPPEGAVYWQAFDPGTRLNNAALWCHVDVEKRQLVVCNEYLSGNMAAAQHAAAWKQIEAARRMRRVQWRVGDPNINTRDRGTNMRLSDQYRRLGFNFNLGPRMEADRIPMLGQLIYLNRFKVMRSLTQTTEQIGNYRWQDITPAQRAKGEDPPEKALKKDVDLVDCAQYLSSRWTKPLHRPPPEIARTFSDEIHKLVRKHNAKRAQWARGSVYFAA